MFSVVTLLFLLGSNSYFNVVYFGDSLFNG